MCQKNFKEKHECIKNQQPVLINKECTEKNNHFYLENWLRGTATRQTYLGKAKKKFKENNTQETSSIICSTQITWKLSQSIRLLSLRSKPFSDQTMTCRDIVCVKEMQCLKRKSRSLFGFRLKNIKL